MFWEGVPQARNFQALYQRIHRHNCKLTGNYKMLRVFFANMVKSYKSKFLRILIDCLLRPLIFILIAKAGSREHLKPLSININWGSGLPPRMGVAMIFSGVWETLFQKNFLKILKKIFKKNSKNSKNFQEISKNIQKFQKI